MEAALHTRSSPLQTYPLHSLILATIQSKNSKKLGYLPSRMAGAADQAVSDAIEGENGGILRKGAAFVYRGAANAADNLARMAVSSAIGGPALGMGVNSAFSFTQGFQSTYREAQEKGGSPLQGLLVGSVDGGMEVFTESKTFERWMNLKDPELIGDGVYEWLKYAAIGIGNEITEEEASYIANTIADAVVMADKSESAEYIKAAVAEGKTPAQARWELVKKYAHEMAVTAADTAMSTILMEGATGAVANYQYKKTYGGSSAELVQEGLESPEGTKSRELAEQYQKKLDEGNLNELQLMFRSFSDVLTEVPGLKIPKMRGGGVQIVECEPGKFQKDYMKSLEKRANNVKNVDPSEDNMLKITSDGRKVSYTQRMIDPTLPYEPGCKLYRCCENILKEYRDGKNIKTVDGKTGKTVTINGTQIVFCDMATPKGKDKSKANDEITTEIDDSYDAESARLYEDMRDYLVKKAAQI